MKKLMVMAFAVATAAVTQAASWSWGQNSDGYGYAGQGEGSEYLSGSYTAYLFDAATITQDTLVKSWNGTTFTGTSIEGANSTAVGDTGITQQSFSYDAGTSLTAYYAFIADGKLFVSEAKTVAQQSTSTAGINFGDPWAASTAAAMDASKGFNGIGWYAAGSGPEPTPEPTSGLLLLLGVAGLALRRKQA